MQVFSFAVLLTLVGYTMAGSALQCNGQGRGGSTISAGRIWCPSGDNCTSASECSGSCTHILSGTYWICYTGFCVCTDYYGKTTVSPGQGKNPYNASALPCINYWNILIALCIATLMGGEKLRC